MCSLKEDNVERLYEGMLVLTTDISEQAQGEIFQKITKRIESLEGKVVSSRVWAKERSLAFTLKSRGAQKKKHSKACYWLVVFWLDTDKLADLKETIRLEESILRSLILKSQTQSEKAIA
jgi:ribosomal protein S6